MKTLLRFIAPILMAGALVACGTAQSNITMGNSTASAGFEQFKTGFYQFTQTQNCAMCHGHFQVPLFAVADPAAAYQAAIGLLNKTDPANSLFASYAGNNHCGQTICSDAAVVPTVKMYMQQWAAAENGGGTSVPTGPKYLTGEVAVPANLPSLMSATPAVMRFNLSTLNPTFAAFSGAVLEIEIQRSNATTYRLNNVKVAGNSAAVMVTGIHVYVKAAGTAGKGTEDTAQGAGWISVSATAPVFALPNPLPTGPLGATPLSTTSINVNQSSTSDVLTIGIDNLQ